MFTRTSSAIALAFLFVTAVAAADDPFCGKWKLNPDRSKISGERMKMEDLGNDKFKFTFGNESDIVKLDGTDQPVHFGRTTAITKESPTEWKMVNKKDGKVINSMTHVLSEDGNTQTIKGTYIKPDGSTNDYEVVNKRVGKGSGFAGTWESTNVKISSPDQWEIEPFESNGLSFVTPSTKETLEMKFDGKDYAYHGPRVPDGATAAGKRTNGHTLEMTNKIQGRVMDRTHFEVSPDGKTLTLTIHETGQQNPITIVYDKL